MGTLGEVVVGLVVLVGLVGIVVQVLPGLFLVAGAVVAWGVLTGGAVGWTVVVFTVLATGAAFVGQYLLAGRHLKRAGVPFVTMVVGGILGIVGFFLIPVVGLLVGFVLGVFLAEWLRSGDHRTAWRSTVAALQATGLTILVELAGALMTTTAWIVGLLLT
ncbi:DUF456 domain-containing protein [Cellulomonas sp. URHE0023]|uniref:DUF456 domain-containing protein n=1 Tax=Cellulomonas sp. URHE0023 TaxID=1380354 RepID=UPI0004887DAD|nr:DUF456 domain-containing protein [Cellulomonas sp. URHE0023]